MKWFRLYHDLLNDPKVQELRPELFKVWVNLLCLASSRDERGTLPSDAEIAFALRIRRNDAVRFTSELRARNLLEGDTDGGWIVHGWDARQRDGDADPTAADRQKRYRERKASRVTSRVSHDDVTPLDTEKIQTREEEINTPPVSLRSTSPKGARIPAQWPKEIHRTSMIELGVSLGLTAQQTEEHWAEYHDYWSQATKNATSMDWLKRWGLKIKEDVRVGRVGGRASPAKSNGQYKTAAEKSQDAFGRYYERIKKNGTAEGNEPGTAIVAHVAQRGVSHGHG